MTNKRTLALEAPKLVGEIITLQGWVNNKRDHGKLTFVDLRDRSGLIQCVGQKMMSELSNETVVAITGVVQIRPEHLVNPDMETGTIEISVQSYEVLNVAHELPIQVKEDGLNEDEQIRLRYRYLDLRRHRLNKIMRLRSAFNAALREALLARDFVEVETPMLTKATKEGARDFIVPSRFQPGKFYALPQSPQQYKQLLMTAGIERYFQFARCIRDEDLRADRGFEFTQLDMELSFVDRDTVMRIMEEIIIYSVEKVGGVIKQKPFPVFDYQEALQKYGADKFDLRSEEDKANGVLAFAWVINFPFFKQVDKADVAEVRDGKSGWTFTHNPFSAPLPEFLDDHLKKQNIGQILTTQYDLVCNGYEGGGGSIRAHQPDVLRTTFEIMGYSAEEIEASVGHMLEAFKLGTPPHGGIAFGLDRLVMLLAKEMSIKETIAFPMTSTGRTAVMDAPSPVSDEQLKDLHIRTTTAQKQKGENLYTGILKLLEDNDVSYRLAAHAPITTSEECVQAQGVTMHQGAKALLLEADKELVLYVIPADQRADLDGLALQLGKKKVKMVSLSTMEEKFGLQPGAVPPLGSLLGVPTYFNNCFAPDSEIAFSAARRDRSIIMKLADYLEVENPQLL